MPARNKNSSARGVQSGGDGLFVSTREDKGDREGIPHTHPIT